MSNDNSLNTPLQRISSGIDALIKKHGSEKTADFIETISKNHSLDFDKVNIELPKFILSEIITNFKVRYLLFQTCDHQRYKRARMSCFYFYRIYCNYSLLDIKNKFPKIKERTRSYVSKNISKVSEVIKMPSIDKEHYRLHMKVDEKIREYIKKQSKS